MGIAAYNRGSRAISDQITQECAKRRMVSEVPALPVGWRMDISANLVEVYDGRGVLVHREAIPFRMRPDLNRAAIRALDPCLRNPNLPRDGGHALNGWQLHYAHI